MSLIDTSFFTGPLINIPNVDKPEVSENLQLLIDEKEEEFLRDVLGVSLYNAFKAATSPYTGRFADLVSGKDYTDNSTILRNWKGLVKGTRSPIANYIFYWYLRNNVTLTTGNGEVVNTSDNSKPVSSADKQARVWNEMVEWIYELMFFLRDNSSVYPEYSTNTFYGQWSTVWTERGWLYINSKWSKINSMNI